MADRVNLAFIIRGYQPAEMREPLYQQLKSFIEKEGFTTSGSNEDFIVDILGAGEKEHVCAYTPGAIRIENFSAWLPLAEARFEAMVKATGVAGCRTEVEVTD